MKDVESFEQVKTPKAPVPPGAVLKGDGKIEWRDHKIMIGEVVTTTKVEGKKGVIKTVRPAVVMRAPLEKSGYLQMFDDTHGLCHSDLVKIAPVIGLPLPTRGEVDTYTLAQVISGELIVRWYMAMGQDPSQKIHQNHYDRVMAYRELVEKLNRGEVIMAKKSTKSAKSPKVFQVVAYEVVGGKVESKDGKRYMEKENNSHNAVIYRALRAAKEPLTFEQVMESVGSKAFGSESKAVENIYRWHINDLRKRGLVRSTAEKVEAASAAEARAGEGSAPAAPAKKARKPRASKPAEETATAATA